MRNIYLTLLLLVTAFAGAQIINFADGNVKSRLLNASALNNIAADVNGVYMAIDANGDNEIEVAEAVLVYFLDLSASGIQQYDGLENFINLRVLKCRLNGATNINLNAFANLEEIDANPSQLTGIDLTPLPNLKKLSLYAPAITSINLENNPLLANLTIGGGALASLDVSNQTLLDSLNCASNTLTSLDLSNNLQLRSLRCTSNQIATLDVSMLTNLRTLQVGANNLTSINILPLTALNVLEVSGNNLGTIDISTLNNLITFAGAGCGFSELDLSSNTQLNHLYVGDNQLTALDISNQSQLIALTFYGNQISEVDFSTNPNLGWIDCASNVMLAIDVSMLSALQTFDCSDNSLLTLDVSNNPNLCIFNASGNAQMETIFMKNGNGGCPLEFVLNNNPTLQYVCTDEDEVLHFTEYFGGDVAVTSYCSLPPGGDYNTITGVIRIDVDNNGCDSDDPVIPYQKLDINGPDGNGIAFTNAAGEYTLYVGAGNYMLFPNFQNNSYFTLNLPVSFNFPSVDNSVETQDFCLVPNGIHHDVEVFVTPVIVARPGFDAAYKIIYRNKGNQAENGTITFNYESDVLQLFQVTPLPDSQTTGQLAFNYSNLLPFQTREILIKVQVNEPGDAAPVNVGDTLDFLAQISQAGTDDTPLDNAFTYIETVIGSYDPNNLVCLEGALEPVENIGEYLNYVANFENTGTDVAVNIVVKTVFDEAQFDVNSLRVLHTSDAANVLIDGNKVNYVFNDINLAIGGHGNILLKIKTRDNLTNGDMVANRADIYFDYNLPITTNDAETTFQMLSVGEPKPDASIAVYPNPTTGIVNISASTNIQSLQLFDVQGRLLQTALRNEPAVSIDISGKQAGIYFVKVTSDHGTAVQKIVKK